MTRRIIIKSAFSILEIILFPILIFLCFIARYWKKNIDVGLGPQPLINNIYHKRSLIKYGYSAQTFVTYTFYITSDFDKKYMYSNKFLKFILINILHIDFISSIFTYKCLYIYFNGGPLQSTIILWKIEPYLLKLAQIKTVIMPYGSDVQELSRTPNLLYRHAMISDYPSHKYKKSVITKKIDLWSSNATHVISGCDWVDYMHHWDTLMVAHFSIDTSIISEFTINALPTSDKFRILHAPNHREIKGTKFVIDAVHKLQQEGEQIELVLLEKVSNQKIFEEIQKADLVIDQLIIGWYAMFAIEALLHSKPVLCYLRDDLVHFYRSAGLIEADEPPLINSNPLTLLDDLRKLIHKRTTLLDYGQRGLEYVKKYHSTEHVGSVFDSINRSIGLTPSLK